MDNLITYDLRRPGQDYTTLTVELERLGAHRILESVWFLKNTSNTALQLRDHLTRFIDGNDRLFVASVTTWAGRQLMSDPNSY